MESYHEQYKFLVEKDLDTLYIKNLSNLEYKEAVEIAEHRAELYMKYRNSWEIHKRPPKLILFDTISEVENSYYGEILKHLIENNKKSFISERKTYIKEEYY